MTFQSGFFTDYLDPLQVDAQIAELVHAFPHLCRVEELPFLSHGYFGANVEARGQHRIKVLRVTAPDGAASKPAVLLMRSPHPRERINPLCVLETARQLVTNYLPGEINRAEADPRVVEVVTIMQNVEFILIPESNPDGARAHFFDVGFESLRKNLRPPTSCRECKSPSEECGIGVDCNRNYPRYWGTGDESSPCPCDEKYRGPAPLSEPETMNIAFLVERERNIIFAIDSHSAGNDLFRPVPVDNFSGAEFPVSPEDDAVYRHLEETMNNFIERVQGVRYSTGSTSNHQGTSDEYLFFDHHIYGFNLECGNNFKPPFDEASKASLEVAEAAKALGLCAAGVTGLPINDILQQRRPVNEGSEDTAAYVTPIPQPFQLTPRTPEHAARFLLTVNPKLPQALRSEYELLLAHGFDIRLRTREKNFEIVASAFALTQLLRLGYRPLVERDLF